MDLPFRDRFLIKYWEGGWLQNGRGVGGGGEIKFYPYKKEGGGGDMKSLEVI